MQDEKRPCDHTFAPLGFEVVGSDDQKIETIACVFCTKCSMFRTKILYYDRQHRNGDDKNLTQH